MPIYKHKNTAYFANTSSKPITCRHRAESHPIPSSRTTAQHRHFIQRVDARQTMASQLIEPIMYSCPWEQSSASYYPSTCEECKSRGLYHIAEGTKCAVRSRDDSHPQEKLRDWHGRFRLIFICCSWISVSVPSPIAAKTFHDFSALSRGYSQPWEQCIFDLRETFFWYAEMLKVMWRDSFRLPFDQISTKNAHGHSDRRISKAGAYRNESSSQRPSLCMLIGYMPWTYCIFITNDSFSVSSFLPVIVVSRPDVAAVFHVSAYHGHSLGLLLSY